MALRRLAVILAVAALGFVGAGSPLGTPARDAPRPDRIVVLRPADALGALVAGFADVWVDDRARERLLRVDGRTGLVRAEIPVDGRVALAAAPDALWALQSGGGQGVGLRGPLLRIDPRSDRVRARIPLRTAGGRLVLGFGVRAAGADVWVWGPRDILRIDARAGRVAARIAVGGDRGELTGFAAGARQVVAGTADGHLLGFDARTLRRTAALRVGLPRPSPRALRGGRAVVTASGAVAAVDLAAGRVAWQHRLGFRAGATLAGDDLVWVHSGAVGERGDRVTAIRLASGRVVTSGVVPGFGSTGIAYSDGRVWTATAGGALLVLTPFPA